MVISMYICDKGNYYSGCKGCEHLPEHEAVNCCDEQSKFCRVVRNIVKCQEY